MPLYHFNTRDGGLDPDRVGTELPDHDAARREAVRFAGSVLTDEPQLVWNGREFRVEVTDEAYHPICTVLIRAVDNAELGEDSRKNQLI